MDYVRTTGKNMPLKAWKLDRTSTYTGHLIFQIWKTVMLVSAILLCTTAVDFTSNEAAHHNQSQTILLLFALVLYFK